MGTYLAQVVLRAFPVGRCAGRGDLQKELRTLSLVGGILPLQKRKRGSIAGGTDPFTKDVTVVVGAWYAELGGEFELVLSRAEEDFGRVEEWGGSLFTGVKG